jgi:hypothetical protein
MKRYIKDNVVKLQSDIVIATIIDGQECNIYNPSEEQVLNDGWEELVVAPSNGTPSIERIKLIKIREIEEFDSSPEVNEFYINGQPCWLDKATRVGLMLRFDSELAQGISDTTLWYNDIRFDLPIETAKMMLYALETYASQCYDNTRQHVANINQMNDIEEIRNYNFMEGYPDKLSF